MPQASALLDAASAGMFEATVPSGYRTSVLDSYRNFSLIAYPGRNGISTASESYDTSLWLLLGTTGLVLLIACANLANLLLVRASTREQEMAVRLALGASAGRIRQQLLLESLVLAVGGSILGTGLASFFSKTVVRMLSTERSPFFLATNIDWRVLSFTAFVAVSTCLLFGLAPALRSSRTQPAAVLKSGGRGMTAGRKRFSFQQTLVVSQIAFSLVLLTGALLFVRSFWNLMTLDPGFRETGILRTYLNFRRLDLPPERYETFKHDLLEQIRSIPQVESAASSTHVPLDGSYLLAGCGRRRQSRQSQVHLGKPRLFPDHANSVSWRAGFHRSRHHAVPSSRHRERDFCPPVFCCGKSPRQNLSHPCRASLPGKRIRDCRRGERYKICGPARGDPGGSFRPSAAISRENII